MHDVGECPDCHRRADVEYRCSACDERFTIAGEFRHFVQAHGHWHVPDEEIAWQSELIGHLSEHGQPGADAVMVPVTEMPA
jgi:hypothetical protein